MAIRLYTYVGDVSEDQYDFLMDNLEEEWAEDCDFYLNKDMIDGLATKGADATLVQMLREALANKDEIEILLADTDEMEFVEDEEDDDD